MPYSRSRTSDRARSLGAAMLCAAAVTAQLVGAKATRDALFLTSLDLTVLPSMLMAAAIVSIALVAAYGRWAARFGSARLVPASFVISSAMFGLEWLTRAGSPSVTAIIVYLHVSAVGPLLTSGFWLLASEGFDPRTAKRRFGQIAGAGTLGGLLGALVSERVAAMLGVPAMLLVLGGFQLLSAYLSWRLAHLTQTQMKPSDAGVTPPIALPERSGLRVIAEAPHLRRIVGLVLLGTTSAALLEYLFKAKAVETFGPGDNLLRFFALYYAAASILTFVIQVTSSRVALQRFGVALTTSTPSIAVLAGGLSSLIAPGLGGVLVARAGESIFRGSMFRAGYELLFTPLPAAQKRAAKSVVDVGFDRLGDAVGGALVRLTILFAPAAQSSTILLMAMLSSVGAIVVASRLNRWYLRTLETSLIARGSGVDLTETGVETLRTVVHDAQRRYGQGAAIPRTSAFASVAIDPEAQDMLWLRSNDRERIIDVLTRPDGLPAGLVSYAIPLLARDSVADHALFALRKVAEEHIGQLVDALVDPNQEEPVRRRLPRVFSVCVSQRAADGLIIALDDDRPDVRFHAARSLAAILDKNPRIQIDRDRIYDVVLREVAANRPVPESLGHVFTLLSLVLPREALRIAFRSLESEDRQLRGTALEYLEGVLPPAIRERLWPFLVNRRLTQQPALVSSRIMADRPRSGRSVTLRRVARPSQR